MALNNIQWLYAIKPNPNKTIQINLRNISLFIILFKHLHIHCSYWEHRLSSHRKVYQDSDRLNSDAGNEEIADSILCRVVICKLADCRRGRPESSFFSSYYTNV